MRGKMYTLDNKLLTGTPEIRIGSNIYQVDDREGTVEKMLDEVERLSNGTNKEQRSLTRMVIRAGLAKQADEVLNSNLSYAALQAISELVMDAMIGREPEDAGFPKIEKEEPEPEE